ncbi:hypothetical protein U9M48_025543, partial [Paspalum notatum var. saurae]
MALLLSYWPPICSKRCPHVTVQDLCVMGCSIELGFLTLGAHFREACPHVTLTDGIEDKFRWRWEADGLCSSSSAYHACFLGSTFFLGAKFIWKAISPTQ